MSQDDKEINEVTYGEFKGNKTITLPVGPRGFTFGLNKAKAIIKYFEEIKEFAEKNAPKGSNP